MLFRSMPIVVVDATTLEGIVEGARVHVEAMDGDGRVVVGA